MIPRAVADNRHNQHGHNYENARKVRFGTPEYGSGDRREPHPGGPSLPRAFHMPHSNKHNSGYPRQHDDYDYGVNGSRSPPSGESSASLDMEQPAPPRVLLGPPFKDPGEVQDTLGHPRDHRRQPSRDPDDLTDLEELSQGTIEQALQSRYEAHQMNTYIGDILISINPYEDTGRFTKIEHEIYCKTQNVSENPPHIYHVASTAYRHMRASGQPQAIVVSGESGAGKTECTKHIISQLTYTGNNQTSSTYSSDENDLNDLAERLLKANPVIEAFGNAQTVMNWNSSRFGKLMVVHFTREGRIQGGYIQHYLLEKSRVVRHAVGESNYHIFYYMFAGMTSWRLAEYHLDQPHHHRILRNCEGFSHAEEKSENHQLKFLQLEEAFRALKFTDQDLEAMYGCLAAVLLLADLQFDTDEDNEDNLSTANEGTLHKVAELLGVSHESLEQGLLSNSQTINGEVLVIHHTEQQALDVRDALVKALYEHLFTWIVDSINDSLCINQRKIPSSNSNQVGILDFSGFEIFPVNSFEQLCINSANERLQEYFTSHVFILEQQRYLAEGLEWSYVDFPKNDDHVRLLFDRQTGIFSLIDEESRFPQGTDVTLKAKLEKYHDKTAFCQFSPRNSGVFAIKHYAGTVWYDTEGFLVKNRDRLSEEISRCLVRSSRPLIRQFQELAARSGVSSGRGKKSSALRTQGVAFQSSLHKLMGKLSEANPMFVRCLKPNSHQKAQTYDSAEISRQLRYSGVLQITEIRRLGFPISVNFATFNDRFRLLFRRRAVSDKALAARILDRSLHISQYAVGKTKVFLKQASANELNKAKRHEAARVLQRSFRRYITLQKEEALRKTSAHDDLASDESSFSSDQEQLSDTDKLPWDFPQVVPRERAADEDGVLGKLLIVMRVLTYGFLGLAVWSCSSLSQLSLLLAARHYGMGQYNHLIWRGQDLTVLLSIVCFPRAIIFITTLMKTMFGNLKWPSFKYLFISLFLESGQSFGETCFLFRVLPRCGLLMSVGLFYSVGLIPASLKIMFSQRNRADPTLKRNITRILDITAFFMQLSAIVYPLVLKGLNVGVYNPETLQEDNLYWELPLSLILISTKWWENFIDKSCKRLTISVVLENLQQTRTKTSMLMSFWGMCVSIITGTMYFWMDGGILWWSDHAEYDTGIQVDIAESLGVLSPALMQLISSFVCFYLGSVAIKLMMQRVSFSLPLYLSLPTVLLIVVLHCEGILPDLPAILFVLDTTQCETDIHWGYALAIVFWIVSLLWTARHVWWFGHEKLAKRDRLFVMPFYLGMFLVPSLLLNRRARDNEANPNGCGEQGTSSKVSMTEDKKPSTTRIFACATMWHETPQEMTQLLKSYFRLDRDQNARFLTQKHFGLKDPDYYDFEGHIFFDDAMKTNANGHFVLNDFVRTFMLSIDEAASAILQRDVEIKPPERMPTPYGGRLTWTLPGKNKLVVHVKNKKKIRNRKRWSQVMYMYYLLSYLLFGKESEDILKQLQATGTREDRKMKADHEHSETKSKIGESQGAHYGTIFKHMEQHMIDKADHTYVLALDGDVDFQADAVRILVDRMKKNPKVGATCGRIHPIGSGPLVWYQKFEYAVGHWFQKATEHVLGSVLCSPGCFSLFRASSLISDNVMKKYATVPTRPEHLLQYDQGEDRWLCTLLLQQGYKIDYAAASDAYTFAPEAFSEFFNQRRRWITSTLANQLDLLNDYRNTIRANDNISLPFIAYQLILTVSTILGPATIVLIIVTSFQNILNLKLWEAYLVAVIPPALFILACHIFKPKTQIALAGAFSAAYAGVMLVVLVNLIVSFATDKLQDVSLLFVTIVAGCFILAGILHPYEICNLIPGFIYYLCIPAGYLILVIYAYANMHVVSWGTREGPKDKEELEALEQEKAKKSKTWWSTLTGNWFAKEIKDFLLQVAHNKTRGIDVHRLELNAIKKELKKIRKTMTGECDDLDQSECLVAVETDSPNIVNNELNYGSSPKGSPSSTVPQENPMYPEWMKEEDVGEGPVIHLDKDENKFWEKFIKKYEKPDRPLKKQEDIEKQDELKAALSALRNNSNFSVWFINGLWLLLNYLFQSSNAAIGTITIFNLEPIEPLALLFLVPFVMVMGVQVLCMCIHRLGVFMQLLSITKLPNPILKRKFNSSKSKSSSFLQALRLTYDLQLGGQSRVSEPAVDYDDQPLPHPMVGPDGSHDSNAVYRLLQQSRRESKKLHDLNYNPKTHISRAIRYKMHRSRSQDFHAMHSTNPSLYNSSGRRQELPSMTNHNKRYGHWNRSNWQIRNQAHTGHNDGYSYRLPRQLYPGEGKRSEPRHGPHPLDHHRHNVGYPETTRSHRGDKQPSNRDRLPASRSQLSYDHGEGKRDEPRHGPHLRNHHRHNVGHPETTRSHRGDQQPSNRDRLPASRSQLSYDPGEGKRSEPRHGPHPRNHHRHRHNVGHPETTRPHAGSQQPSNRDSSQLSYDLERNFNRQLRRLTMTLNIDDIKHLSTNDGDLRV